MTLQTIVVPVDGSTLALRAVPTAAAVAAAGQAKVRLLSVAHNEGELAWAYDPGPRGGGAAARRDDVRRRRRGRR